MRNEAVGCIFVDLLVLSLVRKGENYGYAITQALVGFGVKGLSEATVYACLRRLHERGLLASRQVVARNGKARRYYSLTPEGEAYRAQEERGWVATRDAMTHVLAATAGGGR